MYKLLLIDNDQVLLQGLEAFFGDQEFEVMTTRDGDTALQIIQATPPDLIISAVMISAPNGYQIKEILNQSSAFRDIPFLICTTRSSIVDILNGIVDYQIDDYLTKPFDPHDLLVHVKLLLICSKAKKLYASILKKWDEGLLFAHLDKAFDYLSKIHQIQNSSLAIEQIQSEILALYAKFLNTESIQINLKEHLLRTLNHNPEQELEFIMDQIVGKKVSYSPFEAEVDFILLQLFLYHFLTTSSMDEEVFSENQIKKMNDQNFFCALKILSKALECSSHERNDHRKRLADLMYKFTGNIQYEDVDLEQVYLGAYFHDLGMINIPKTIYQKKGKVSPEEFKEIQKHPLYAFEVLSKIDYLEPIVQIPRYHHERWNGNGYPYGLSGESIPLEARIFSILDSWVSMTSNRVFRSAFSWEEVAVYFEKETGVSFQKELLETFLELLLTGRLEK